MHHIALNGSRPHNGNLNNQIVEIARFQTRQHVHLRAAFHLKHPDCLGTAQHVVNIAVFGRHGRQFKIFAVMGGNKVKTAPDRAQHAQCQHIDFQHAQRVQIILVPFDESAVCHGRISDWNHFVEAFIGDDEAADMLRQMPRKPDQFGGHIQCHRKRRFFRVKSGFANMFGRRRSAAATPVQRQKRTGHIAGKPHRLGNFTHSRAAAIGDHRCRNAGAFTPVFLVNILNDFFAPLMFEININIWRLIALGRNKAFKQQIQTTGIDCRDAKAITHGGIGRRATTLTQNALAARKLNQIVNGQKIRRIGKFADELQLIANELFQLLWHRVGKPPARTLPNQLFQQLLGRKRVIKSIFGILIDQIIKRKPAGR